MQETDNAEGRPLASERALEIWVALIFLALSGVLMFESVRLGIGWEPALGPAAGFFPFYIGVLMAIASLINLVKAAVDRKLADEVFVTRPQFGRVLAMLLPAIVFVGLVEFLGIYVAAVIYITAFMMYFGGYNPIVALTVSITTMLVTYWMFELRFLQPLPKGPFEAWVEPIVKGWLAGIGLG